MSGIRGARGVSLVAGWVALVAFDAAAQDWPQWRGPSSQGVSVESRLPTRWSLEENLAWTAPLAGVGTSSPIIWGGMVVVTSQVGGSARVGRSAHPQLARDDKALAAREGALGGSETAAGPVWFVVEAFDSAAGRKLWDYRVEAAGELPEVHEKHNLATPTPVADGKRIYAWFGNGQLIALDMTGKPVWSRHLGRELGVFRTTWGHGSSPALFGQLLYLLCDHLDRSYLVALDADTGKERWKVDRGTRRVSHSTPVVVQGPSGAELVVNSSERVDAYDPRTGELLWHLGSERQTPIPTPVSEAGMIFLSRGYRNSDYLAVRSGGRGDVSGTHVAWRAPSGASYVPSILHYDGLIYLTNEVGVVTCADARTGETVWRHRLGGVFFASPVAGDGKVYFTSETGETYVIRAGRTAELLATNDLGERFLASPAISRGRLFLRADGRLFAVGR
jgi:outer membrane protein assembly factor BamB